MKVNASALRTGNIIEHDGRLLQVMATEITKPGKGGAFATHTLRDIRTGSKDVIRFRSQESVTKARLDDYEYQFLFTDGETYTFMDTSTYEQIELGGDLIGSPRVFLQDGMMVTVQKYDEEALGVELPTTVTMQIVECEPVVKGQTATSSYKPGQLENGERILIPPHIDAGTRVVVKTEDGTYVERAKD